MQEEFAFQVDAFELPVELRQHSFKKFVEKIHSPLDGRYVVGDEVFQEARQNQIRECDKNLPRVHLGRAVMVP